jgi:hypothetical protein
MRQNAKSYSTINNYAESDTRVTQQEPVSLSQMIAKNRQQLSTLRSMFLGNDKLDS